MWAADPAVPQGDPVAPPAILPSLPAIPRNPNGFRAYSTRLNYTDDWEKSWRVGPYTDVVVRFPNSDAAFLFPTPPRKRPCTTRLSSFTVGRAPPLKSSSMAAHPTPRKSVRLSNSA